MLAASSCAFSSNIMKTPCSPNCIAPSTMKVAASMVLPHPGPPTTKVGRPRGRPPPVISSRPPMPVKAFCSGRSEPFVLSFMLAGWRGVVPSRCDFPGPCWVVMMAAPVASACRTRPQPGRRRVGHRSGLTWPRRPRRTWQRASARPVQALRRLPTRLRWQGEMCARRQ